MSNCDLISVIIPTRNRVGFLLGAIRSVSKQTWPRIEIIIVDDASTDQTPDLINKFKFRGESLKVIRNKNPIGGAASRNVGIAAARGRWVAFLDDDDEWLPDKLSKQCELIAKDPSISAVSCSYFVRSPFKNLRLVRLFEITNEDKLLSENLFGGASGCFASRERLLELGGFDEKLASAQDFDLWIRLWNVGHIAVIDAPLTIYVPHSGHRISNNMQASYSGLRRIYFRYRHRMSSATRRRYLSIQLCRRTLIYRGNTLFYIKRFYLILKIGGFKRACSCGISLLSK